MSVPVGALASKSRAMTASRRSRSGRTEKSSSGRKLEGNTRRPWRLMTKRFMTRGVSPSTGHHTATLGRATMDDAPQTGEFVVGESFARILTQTTQSLVCVLDRDGRILLFNEACERATGYRREEVLGADARDFVIPPEEREAFGEFLAYVFKTGTPSPQVGHWQTKQGRRRLIAWSNHPMGGGDGEPPTLVTTGIDLTDRAAPGDDGALAGDPGAKLAEIGRLATEQRALRRV